MSHAPINGHASSTYLLVKYDRHKLQTIIFVIMASLPYLGTYTLLLGLVILASMMHSNIIFLATMTTPLGFLYHALLSTSRLISTTPIFLQCL